MPATLLKFQVYPSRSSLPAVGEPNIGYVVLGEGQSTVGIWVWDAGAYRSLGKTETSLNGLDTSTVVASGTSSLSTYVKAAFDAVLSDDEAAADLANSQIIVPAWANRVRVKGHASFPLAAATSGLVSIHLWRNVRAAQYLTRAGAIYYPSPTDADRPTPEGRYHNRVYAPTDVGAPASHIYVSCIAETPWLPVMALNERWTLYLWQGTGAAITCPGNEQWLSAEFAP